MITEIPELHPNELLYWPYNYSTDSLARLLDISKNTQTLILTIFSGAIATYEDS